MLVATVLGSSLTFVDTTVVSVALPAVGADLGAGSAGLTRVVNNAVARTGGLLAVAAIPLVGEPGEAGLTEPEQVREGFPLAMSACADLLAARGAAVGLGAPPEPGGRTWAPSPGA